MDGLESVVLRRTSTAQQVADGLTDLILNGNIAPGQTLKESAIAASLGVARNTVREAVRILELGGLVRRPEMHRGAVVIEPTDEELTELYLVRLRLECAAAAITTPSTLPPVRAAHDALVAASRAHVLADIVQRDLEFHMALVGQLGSRRIDTFYAQITRELRFFWMVISAEDREFENPDQVIKEHTDIMRTLEAGDLTAAQALITAVIEENVARVRAIFAERKQK